MRALALALLALLGVGCGSEQKSSGAGGTGGASSNPQTVEDLRVDALEPTLLLPGTRFRVRGSFPPEVDELRLTVSGQLDGLSAELSLPLERDENDETTSLVAAWPGAPQAGLPAETGTLTGTLQLLGQDAIAPDLRHESAESTTTLTFETTLTPELDSIEASPVAFVNDLLQVRGSGFLLDGAEGQTRVTVSGCFQPAGETECAELSEVELSSQGVSLTRDRLEFPFAPAIAGIGTGQFRGSVQLVNELPSAALASASSAPLELELVPPRVFEISPTAASLGQYVDVRGGGFVGLTPDDETPAATRLLLDGTFTPTGLGGSGIPASLSLVAEYVSGQVVRYVPSEEDELGAVADLRSTTGIFSGEATPVVRYGDEEVTGASAAVSLELLPVKQVVWVRFTRGYVESLELFGLRALDARLRERVLAVAERDFGGVLVELRTAEPTDFALYSQVEISGPDPNGLGLFGYDNTPGKDVGNARLYDRIGGVNALTQEDGFPGYGGIFVESLFGFSENPPPVAQRLELATPLFDQLFDAFRPDLGGSPVLAAEVSSIPALTGGESCPAAAAERPVQAACAVWALGSLIGGTLSHELAHSLGLAQPEGSGFHNETDAPGRLMDSGSARPFEERAEVNGAGPAVLCQQSYDYLRSILASSQPDPLPQRPSCE